MVFDGLQSVSFSSGSPRSPSPSIMIRTQVTPLSSAALLQLLEIGRVVGLVLEELVDELDGLDAVLLSGDRRGSRGWSIFLAKRALCSDHSASEILKSGCFVSSRAALRLAVKPSPAVAAREAVRKSRRSMVRVMAWSRMREGIGAGGTFYSTAMRWTRQSGGETQAFSSPATKKISFSIEAFHSSGLAEKCTGE